MARGKKKESALTPEEKLAQALVPEDEQPYKVSENWCWTRTGNIAEVASGGTPSSSIAEYYENGDIPWISPADLSGYSAVYIDGGAKNITALGLEKSSAKLLPKDTVCLSSRAPIGYVAIASNPLCTNQGFKNFLPSACYLPKYLYWYLKGNKELLESYASGTTFLELSGSKAAMVEIPLAPIAEQQRIVDRIEYLFAKLDEAKEKAQSVLDSFETRKAAILHKAFTGELTAKWRVVHDVSAESWKAIPLKNCGSWYGGGTPSTAHPEYWENGTLLWITSKDMKSDLIEDTLMHTTMQGVENSSAKYIEEPAVLFVMRSGILRRTFPVCMVKKPFTVNQDLKAVVPHDIELEYLFWAAKAAEKDILEKCMKSGTTVESINASALQNFTIRVAGNEEQKEIIHILDGLFTKEQQAKEAAEAVLEKIDLLKKSILARAFRGELGTNDPTEPSALELLKRIL